MHPDFAVILAGGKGQRLGAHKSNHAKPMVKIAGRPFLDHLIDFLIHKGCKKILILAGFRALPILYYYQKKKSGSL
ncbi:MAG: NTP transferase domain-containing protein [Pseudomonadota bacterium]